MTGEFRPERIPEPMRHLRHWVRWEIEHRPDKTGEMKPTKVPKRPRRAGGNAASDDPSTWGGFDQAVAAGPEPSSDCGVGFMFGGCGIVGIDLDRAINLDTGEITPWAAAIVAEFNSYTEVSPSHTGLHIFVYGTMPRGKGRSRFYEGGKVEAYDRGRFFTVTTRHWSGTPETIEPRDTELAAFVARMWPDETPPPRPPAPALSLSDCEILEKCRRAKNATKFASLYDLGDLTDYADDHSVADFALLGILKFYTQDEAQLDQLIRSSALYRPKWDDPRPGGTYGLASIRRALESGGAHYDPQYRTATMVKTRSTRQAPANGNGQHPGEDGDESGALYPVVYVKDRPLRDLATECLRILEEANDPPDLFVRTGELARVRRHEDGRPVIGTVGEPHLRGRLTRVADFFNQKNEHVDPDKHLVQDILAIGEWNFPPLEGVTEIPTLRPDGTVADRPGYDAATKLVYCPAPGLAIPEIPERPSVTDTSGALELIRETIGEFPYVGKPDAANALALLLTPFVRAMISSPVPMALLDKPKAGTGASLLSETISMIASGRPAAMMGAPTTEEEWQKQLTATLLEGATLITIDNVVEPLFSPSLSRALTARTWKGRILGLSRDATLPIRATWMVTGNNVRLKGDMPRRCYRIRMDADTSQPWTRTGFTHPNLLEFVTSNRGRLIAALLTIARAWFAAGRPKADVPTLGGYESWCRTLGGILAHAGVEGFLGNLDAMHDQINEEDTEWAAFFEVWNECLGGGPVTVSKVVFTMHERPDFREALPECLAAAFENERQFQQQLGLRLKERIGTPYGQHDLRVERAKSDTHAKVAQWKVVGKVAGKADVCGDSPQGPRWFVPGDR